MSDEHLAPVTYLPGFGPAAARPAAAAVGRVPADFAPVDSSDVEAEHARGGEASGHHARRAENVSLHGLTRRNMSRWELENLLRSRELDEQSIRAELDRLEGVGLVDDAALAETLVRTQHERKGLGKQAIVAELRRRHIDQDSIDTALEQLDAADERTRAFELAEKRAGQLRSYDNETARRRLTGFLMRKGYSSSIVREAVDAALKPTGGVRFR